MSQAPQVSRPTSPSANRYVLDTFVRPPVPEAAGASERYRQLAAGLAQFEPGYRKYMDTRFRDWTQEQLARAEQDWNENRLQWNDYVREHPEAEGLNPWYRRAYQTLAARNAAEDMQKAILDEYEKNPEITYLDKNGHEVTTYVLDTDDSRATQAWAAQRYRAFGTQFQDMDTLMYAQSVAPLADSMVDKLMETHSVKRREFYLNELPRQMDVRVSQLFDDGEATPDNLTALMGELVSNGMSEAKAEETLINAVSSCAMRTNSLRTFDLFNSIHTHTGSMGEYSAVRDARARLVDKLKAEALQEEARRYARQEHDEKERKRRAEDIAARLTLEGTTDPDVITGEIQREMGPAYRPSHAVMALQYSQTTRTALMNNPIKDAAYYQKHEWLSRFADDGALNDPQSRLFILQELGGEEGTALLKRNDEAVEKRDDDRYTIAKSFHDTISRDVTGGDQGFATLIMLEGDDTLSRIAQRVDLFDAAWDKHLKQYGDKPTRAQMRSAATAAYRDLQNTLREYQPAGTAAPTTAAAHAALPDPRYKTGARAEPVELPDKPTPQQEAEAARKDFILSPQPRLGSLEEFQEALNAYVNPETRTSSLIYQLMREHQLTKEQGRAWLLNQQNLYTHLEEAFVAK